MGIPETTAELKPCRHSQLPQDRVTASRPRKTSMLHFRSSSFEGTDFQMSCSQCKSCLHMINISWQWPAPWLRADAFLNYGSQAKSYLPVLLEAPVPEFE